jgi:uncharacterized protein YlzI (FlbEa/FlbD family)
MIKLTSESDGRPFVVSPAQVVAVEPRDGGAGTTLMLATGEKRTAAEGFEEVLSKLNG